LLLLSVALCIQLVRQNFAWKRVPFECTQQNSSHQQQDYGTNSGRNDRKSSTAAAKMADGCYHVLLDVGANIGMHARFLFEPLKYPNATVAHEIFERQFGPSDSRDNRDICVFAFEPNPAHIDRHLQLQ